MKQSLARNAVVNIIYRLADVIFPLISAGYVARVLSPDGVGRVAYAQNVVSYFVMIAGCGIPSYGTREIARCKANTSEKDQLFSELLLLNIISCAVCLACYCGMVNLFPSSDTALYTVFALELVFQGMNIDWYYQGMEQYGYITLRSIFIKMISLAALVMFVKDSADYRIYALIHCLGIGGNQCFNMIHARKTVRLSLRGMDLMQHIRPLMWLMFSSAAASLYSKVDITMLGILASPASVAYYTNAHKVIGMILALVTAVSGVFLPRLSYVYLHDKNAYGHYLSEGVKFVLILAVPACAGIILVADNLMTALFGTAFLPGASVLRVLAVFTIIKGVGDLLCYQAIISSGNERLLLISRIAAGLTNIGLNAVMIPRLGAYGAAAASVISELVVNGVLLRYALSLARVSVSKKFLSSVLLSTAVMSIFVVSVQLYLGESLISLLGAVAAGIGTYVLVLWLTKNEFLMKWVSDGGRK